MKKIIFPILSIFIITSCNQVNSNSDKTVTQNGDTITSVDVSVTKTGGLMDLVEEVEKADNKLLFKASGTEPGWFAEFYATKLRLVLNYGKDSLWIEDDFSKISNEATYQYSKAKSSDGEKYALAIVIDSKPCTDVAGETANRSVSVKLNNKEYKGCGNIIK